jgi:hypothetical protein
MSAEHYSRVWASIWMEPWADDTRTVALYLLTGPHRRSEGIYRLPLGYATEDLKWPIRRFRAGFDELLACDFIEYDPDAQIVLVVKALKRHSFNGNQHKGIAKALAELPPTPLLKRFVSLCQAYNPAVLEALQSYGVTV